MLPKFAFANFFRINESISESFFEGALSTIPKRLFVKSLANGLFVFYLLPPSNGFYCHSPV
jgi:hypothetical protein